MGVQSLNEELLKFLTRIHGKDEVLKTFKAHLYTHFKNNFKDTFLINISKTFLNTILNNF